MSVPTVKGSDGIPIPISSLWEGRKIVLIFLRQLGCRFCRQQIAEINSSNLHSRLLSHNVHLVCISLGSPSKIPAWLNLTKYKGEIYVDDTTSGDPSVDQIGSESYGVFKLKRGVDVLRLDDVEAQKNADEVNFKYPDMIEIADKSNELIIWPGDVFQTGGAFVLGPGNVCDYAFRSRWAGDHVDLEKIFVLATGVEEGREVIYESTENWFSLMRNDRRLTVSFAGNVVQQTWFQNGANRVVKFFGTRRGVALGLGVGAFGVDKGWGKKDLASSLLIGASVSTFYLGFRALLTFALQPRVKYLDAQNDVILLTPIDIDKKVLESGLPECDCGATMATMPMLGLREAGEVVDKPTGFSRSRSETWSADLGQSNEFQSTLCYVREFLGKPHPAVGRGGPVCPFVPTSLKKNSIYMSVIRTNSIPNLSLDTDAKTDQIRSILVKLLKDFVPVFEKLEPSEGKLRQFKAVILIFPDIKPSEAHDIIDAVQVQAKEFFVERGLMCGEFHETNNASGLRNENFYPLRTPLPCLAIRHMVPGDIAFMTLDDYPVKMRVKLLKGFLEVFGDEDKPQVKEAREKLEETLREIGEGK